LNAFSWQWVLTMVTEEFRAAAAGGPSGPSEHRHVLRRERVTVVATRDFAGRLPRCTNKAPDVPAGKRGDAMPARWQWKLP
jgi:hypothetical protein